MTNKKTEKIESLLDSNTFLLSDDERINYYMAKSDVNELVNINNSSAEFSYDCVIPYTYKKYSNTHVNGSYLTDLEEIFVGLERDICIPIQIGDQPVKTEHFAFCKARNIGSNNSILLKTNTARHWNFNLNGKDTPWIKKLDDVIWRGATTGYANGTDNTRFKLVRNYHTMYNIGFSSIVQGKECWDNYVKKPVSIEEQLKYKFIVSIEGNDVATNLKWVLTSNSVPIMCKPKKESWLMEGLLLPYVHYLPLNEDCSNLSELLDWAKNNDEKCKEISKNGQIYMEQFKDKNKELELQRRLITQYKNSLPKS